MPPLTTFRGELRTNANIRVCGLVQDGTIETTGNVVVTETAQVDGTIQAKAVSLQGTFRGVLRADRVQILAGSQVDGKLYVNYYYTENGANLQAEILSFEDPAAQQAFKEQTTPRSRSRDEERRIPVEVFKELA